jgi:integrase
MNAPFDSKNIVNPFALPSPLTLADVVEEIAAAPLPPAKKRDLLWGLRLAGKVLVAPLCSIPAVLASLGERLAAVQRPSAGRLKPKTWSNMRSAVLAAFEVAGVAPVLRTARTPYTFEWEQLITSRPDKRTRHGLMRFGRFCSANQIPPRRVNGAVLGLFAGALRSGTLAPKANTIVRDTATLWNRLAAKCPESALTRLDLPSRRAAPKRVPWSALPQSFRSDVDAHLAWAAGTDPFDPDARPRPLAPRSIVLRRTFLHAAVTALIESGVPVEEITSLAELTSPERFKAILRARHRRAGEKANAFNEGLAKALVAIAREWVKPSPQVLAELKGLLAKLPKPTPGLTDKNKGLLRQFDDAELQRELIELPDILMRRALAKRLSVRSLADAQAALGIAIQLHAGLRPGNLACLAFDETLFLPKQDGYETRIEFPDHTMKNREPFATVLPPTITGMLRTYRTRILEPLLGQRARFVFDNGAGKPKHATTVSWLIERTIKRHLGVKMTGHQFRHLLAKLVLDELPGAHELVRQALGHRNLQVTTRYYAGFDARRASRLQAALIDKIRGDKEYRTPSRRRPTKPRPPSNPRKNGNR